MAGRRKTAGPVSPSGRSPPGACAQLGGPWCPVCSRRRELNPWWYVPDPTTLPSWWLIHSCRSPLHWVGRSGFCPAHWRDTHVWSRAPCPEPPHTVCHRSQPPATPWKTQCAPSVLSLSAGCPSMECQSIDQTGFRSCAGLGARSGQPGVPLSAVPRTLESSTPVLGGSGVRNPPLAGVGEAPGGRSVGDSVRFSAGSSNRLRWGHSGWTVRQRQR